MFYISIILTAVFMHLPFKGYIETKETFNTYEDCITAKESDQVKSDIISMINSMANHGYTNITILDVKCLESI